MLTKKWRQVILGCKTIAKVHAPATLAVEIDTSKIQRTCRAQNLAGMRQSPNGLRGKWLSHASEILSDKSNLVSTHDFNESSSVAPNALYS